MGFGIIKINVVQKIFSHQVITGLSFGLTTAVITSLGMIVGLNAATSSKLAVVAGIVIVAVADGLSDAMGIHLSEESEAKHSPREVWLSTFFTFLGVCGFTLTFLVPILVFPFPQAIWISIVWGLGLLSLFSFYLAKSQNKNPLKVIFEHNLIAILIIIVTHWLGGLIAKII